MFRKWIYFLTNFFSYKIRYLRGYKSIIKYIDYKFILIKFKLQEMCHFESVTKILVHFIKRQFLLK